VLIVDDITDTGETMRVAVEYIQSLKPSEIRTAALRHITSSKFMPDYFGEEISWRWVIFPWNFTEDMCNIVPKVCARLSINPAGDVDIAQVKKELKQFYTIDTTEETVDEILQELKRRSLIQENPKK
jgi:hypoxanthine phosphoribosyltransferase